MRKLRFLGLLFFLNLYGVRVLAADMAEDCEQAIPILTKTMFLSPYQGPIPAEGIIEIPNLDLVVAFRNTNGKSQVYVFNFIEDKCFGVFDLPGSIVAVSSKQQEILLDVKGPYRTDRVACVVVRQTQLLNEDEEDLVSKIAYSLSRQTKRGANPEMVLDEECYQVVQNMPEPVRGIVSKLVDKETGLRRVMSCIF